MLCLLAHGPFGWLRDEELPCVFDVPAGLKAGVYIWSIDFSGSELVHYVGETGRSFKDRFREHLFAYLSGQYHIYEQASFESGRLAPLWDGMWRYGCEVYAAEFLARRAELADALYLNLRSLRLWLVEIDTDRRQRRLFEGAIATTLRQQPPPIGDFQEADVRYEYRGDDEPSVSFSIKSPRPFRGLPAVIAT